MTAPARLLFVCMGNICRSPTAEGAMADLLAREGLAGRVEIDSAGTGGWHAGDPPDPRSAAAALRRGITLTGRARQVDEADFAAFDLLLAMDGQNRDALLALAPDDRARDKVRMLRAYDRASVAAGELDVPDPYYGGPNGFEHVLDVVTAGCEGLLDQLRADGRV